MVSKQAVRNACQGCLNLTLPGLKKLKTNPLHYLPSDAFNCSLL